MEIASTDPLSMLRDANSFNQSIVFDIDKFIVSRLDILIVPIFFNTSMALPKYFIISESTSLQLFDIELPRAEILLLNP